MIPGAFPLPVGISPKVELVYRGVFNDNSNALSYSFSVDIGTASARRFVVVGIDDYMDTVTVNGTGLSVVHNFSQSHLWGGLVSSGAGTVTLRIARSSVTLGHMSASVWTIKNLHSTTPVGTCGTSSGGTPSDSMTVESGGAAVAIGRSNGGFSSIAFSGVSLDGKINNDADFPIGAGSALTPTSGTLGVSFSSGGVFKQFAAASFR